MNASPVDKKRIFLGVSLPEEIHVQLADVIERWKWLPIRWIDEKNWHITIVPPFYADEHELRQVTRSLQDILKNVEPFSISFSSVTLAPLEQKNARMIWYAGSSSKELDEMKHAVEEVILEHKLIRNYEQDGRPFIPHVTLARFDEGVLAEIEAKTKNLDDVPSSFLIPALNVVESRLKSTGAEYILQSRISLKSEESIDKAPVS